MKKKDQKKLWLVLILGVTNVVMLLALGKRNLITQITGVTSLLVWLASIYYLNRKESENEN